MKQPTPTSYAVLALIAVRPATGYELARQVTRSLNHVWPRAEGRIYDEPKLLVAHGLARGTEELTGRRSATRYSITPKGRRALAAWLAEPGTGPVFECEALLKVAFAEHADRRALVANLEALRDDAATKVAFGDSLADQLLAGDVPFPERLPINALMWTFLRQLHSATLAWAVDALDEVARWPEDLGATPEMIDRALERFRARRSGV